MMVTVSRTDLARNTRQIVEQVRQGHPVIVESYGQEQIVLLDALDYRILRALVDYAVGAESGETDQADLNRVIHAYLSETISLSKAAEEMDLSRFELMDRFERLGIPLRLGPASIEEAREEIRAARRIGSDAS
jgi:prevent-host-death family protein